MDDDDFISVRFYGGCLTAVGMAEFAKNSLNDMLDGGGETPEPPHLT